MSAERKLRQPGTKRPRKQAPGKTGYRYPKPTYRDILEAPVDKVAEIIDGRLYTHPQPAAPHVLATSVLGGSLFQTFSKGEDDPDGWWILDEPELHFGEGLDLEVLVPDLGGWRTQRMPVYPEAAYFTLRPDWVCEALSPSTRHLDLGHKRDAYAREGIPWLWLIDPAERTLEAQELSDQGQWLVYATLQDDAIVSLPPFEHISFPLARLWRSQSSRPGLH